MITNHLNIFLIFLSALLVNNILLIRFIGLCSFFGVSQKLKSSLGMGGAVTFVMVFSSSTTWIIYHFLLIPFHLEYLRTVSFVLVIAALVQLIERFIKKYNPTLYQALGIYLPLITTNCAILAAAFLGIDYRLTFSQNLIYALGVSLGYLLAIVLFSSIRERIAFAPIPQAFKGVPIAFLTAGLMSLAFLGFKGLFGL